METERKKQNYLTKHGIESLSSYICHNISEWKELFYELHIF